MSTCIKVPSSREIETTTALRHWGKYHVKSVCVCGPKIEMTSEEDLARHGRLYRPQISGGKRGLEILTFRLVLVEDEILVRVRG